MRNTKLGQQIASTKKYETLYPVIFFLRFRSVKISFAPTVQETWFDENTPLYSYCIPGSTLISEPHRIMSYGGVAIYLNNKFSYRKLDLQP